MARNGAGTYSLPAGNPVITGTTVSSSWANNTLSDIATALTQSIAVDGQSPITANLPMSGFKFTGLGAGTGAGDSVRYEQFFPTFTSGTGGITLGSAAGITIGGTGSLSIGAGGQTIGTGGAFNLGGTGTMFVGAGGSTVGAGGNFNVGGTGTLGVQAGGITLGTAGNLLIGSPGTINLGGGQIVFPATVNLSANANTLDDYEEGTYVQSVGGTATYTARTATYQKVGNTVSVCANITINAIGSGSSNAITGLPFTPTAVDQAGQIGYFVNVTSSVYYYACYAQASTATMIFCSTTALNNSVTVPQGFIGSGTQIVYSCTYRTAS